MSEIKIPTNLNIDLEFTAAPFHKRVLAWLVDVVISVIYIIITIKIIDSIYTTNSDGTLENQWIFSILMLPIGFYPLILEYTMNGQTIGKKLLHLRVINETGGNATISQYLLRWLLRVADIIMVLMVFIIITFQYQYAVFMLFTFLLAVTDILCMAITKKGQRLGDIAAGTILISTKSRHILNETVFMEVEDDYTVLYPQVMRLSDKDLNTVRNIYNILSKKRDYQLAQNTATKIISVLDIKTNQKPIDFLETLLKDYNFLSTR
ncbi:MAG: RDD family protein [Chitinophagaceae bacterium]